MTVTGNTTTTAAGQLNISGTLTLQGQTSDLTLGDNVTTLNLTSGTHTEGAITLGSGATDATITITGTEDYSGNLTGSGDDNLSLTGGVSLDGTITGFDSVTTGTNNHIITRGFGSLTSRVAFRNNGGLQLNHGTAFYISTLTMGGFIEQGSITTTLDIAGAVTGSSSSNKIDLKKVILRSGASGVIYFGTLLADLILDGVNYSNALHLHGSGDNHLTLRNGATLSTSVSEVIRFTASGTGVNVLDTDLSPSFHTTISGTLQIASGHTLTTSNESGVNNQVTSSGTLDISQLADETAGIGSNGIKVAGGGKLAFGTAKSRNASNITLTKHASNSSIITLDIGTVTSDNTTPIFHTQPAFTGTGTVALEISGSLASGVTQRFATGDVTANYRVTSGYFELHHDGTNTVIRTSAIILTSSDTTLTGKGRGGDQNLTDGSSSVPVIVAGSFNLSSGNLNTVGDIVVQSGATTGTIQANNISVSDATVGNLSLNNTGGKIKLVQSSGGTLTIGTLAGGSSTSDILEVKNGKSTALALGTVSTIETLRLTGGAVSGTLSNVTALEVATAASALNSDLSVTSAALSAVLTGSGDLTVTGNATAGAGQLNISGTLALQGQTSHLTLGDNVITLNLTGGSHTEGNITLGSGATNATVSITAASYVSYTGNLTGSGDDNLSLSGNAQLEGTIVGFDSLTTGTGAALDTNIGSLTSRVSLSNSSSLSLYGRHTYYVSNITMGGEITSHAGTAPTLDIAGVITGSSSTNVIDVRKIILRSGASGVIYFDSTYSPDVIFDGVNYSSALHFGNLGTAFTLRNGATLSSTVSAYHHTNRLGTFTVSGTGTNVLDTDLSPSKSTTISGILQIASGHTLTTGTGAGVSNQVQSGGTLDISQLADETAGIGSNGITVVAGGTLALGTAKSRNASNITLTRHASNSSIITLDLGTSASTSTDAIFDTSPTFTGTGTVALHISGSLASGGDACFG